MRNGQSGRRRGRGGVRTTPASTSRNGGDVGNRLEVRARGNAHQLLEKFKSMARDATTSGDRVTAEYYMQYADHYHRVLNDHRSRQEEARPRYRDEQREEASDDEFRRGPGPQREDERWGREPRMDEPAGSERGVSGSIDDGVEPAGDERLSSEAAEQSPRRGRGRDRRNSVHEERSVAQGPVEPPVGARGEVPEDAPVTARAPRRRAAVRAGAQDDAAPDDGDAPAPRRRRRGTRAGGEKPEGAAELELVDA